LEERKQGYKGALKGKPSAPTRKPFSGLGAGEKRQRGGKLWRPPSTGGRGMVRGSRRGKEKGGGTKKGRKKNSLWVLWDWKHRGLDHCWRGQGKKTIDTGYSQNQGKKNGKSGRRRWASRVTGKKKASLWTIGEKRGETKKKKKRLHRDYITQSSRTRARSRA